MRIHVSQELRQPVGTEFTLDLHQRFLFLDDDVALTDLRGSALLLRTDRGLLAAVKARAHVRGACSRCLSPVQSPIEIDFQEEFIPVVDPISGAHLTTTEAQDEFVIHGDLILDLGESLRQYALMSSPIKPMCRPDCAGLCPTCGINLNDSTCTCETQPDERWQALATLNTEEREGN